MEPMYNFWTNLREGWQIAIVFSIVLPSCILFFRGIYSLFKPNREFFKLINEFHDKLPPSHKKAKENLEKFPGYKAIDTSNMRMNLTPSEIDLFHKKLENFNYSRIVFKRKQIQSYSNNIQRLIRTSS